MSNEPNDREEVLKVYPKAYLSSDGTIRTPIHRSNITYGKFLGMDWADVRSRLPNAPASEDNTSLPMEYIIRHGIGVGVPAPHPAPEQEESPELAQAVEQSENKQDCPSRLGDVVERLSNFPEPVEQGEQHRKRTCCSISCEKLATWTEEGR